MCIFQAGSPKDPQPSDQFKTIVEPLALYFRPISKLIGGKTKASTASFGAYKKGHFTPLEGHILNLKWNSLFMYLHYHLFQTPFTSFQASFVHPDVKVYFRSALLSPCFQVVGALIKSNCRI